MNSKQGVSGIGGFKIIGILSLIVGFPLTIIGGVLLGMFFLYPLGRVIPEDRYINAFEEEFTVLASLLGFGIFFLILGIMFLILGIIDDSNVRERTESGRKGERNKKNLVVKNKEIGMSEQELEKLMKKNIFSDR